MHAPSTGAAADPTSESSRLGETEPNGRKRRGAVFDDLLRLVFAWGGDRFRWLGDEAVLAASGARTKPVDDRDAVVRGALAARWRAVVGLAKRWAATFPEGSRTVGGPCCRKRLQIWPRGSEGMRPKFEVTVPV